MARREIEKLKGLGPDAANIAYQYPCRGFGRHPVTADHLKRLPDGIVEAVVREFTPFGERDRCVGYIDVVLAGDTGLKLCHCEFRVQATGAGGFV